jgi:hypothetical protein
MSPHRFLAACALAVALAACRSTDLEESFPLLEQIPDDATVIYRIEPTLIGYHFRDTTAGQDLELRWVDIPQQPFAGYNCVAFSPLSPTDTVGTFVFVARGPNQGFVERMTPVVTDTVTGYFIGNGQGSRGSFVLDSQNRLTLTWANGTPQRYFDPSAVLRISADSLISDADITQAADSIHATWHVVWTVNAC